jgi:hypothetical protein
VPGWRSVEETAAIQEFVSGSIDEFGWIERSLPVSPRPSLSRNPSRCECCQQWITETGRKMGRCESCGESVGPLTAA